MEAIVGTWKLIQQEDYKKYLVAAGIGEEVAAVHSVLKPVLTITQDDDLVEVIIKTGIGTEEMSFQLGKEFIHERLDSRCCKTVVVLEENQLIQIEKWDDNEAMSVFEIIDGKLINTITFLDITAVQTFERV